MTEDIDKEKEYQDAILHLHGMIPHYLKFIQQSKETYASRIESKNDLIDILESHYERYKNLLPKIDHEKELKRIDDLFNKKA